MFKIQNYSHVVHALPASLSIRRSKLRGRVLIFHIAALIFKFSNHHPARAGLN